MHCFPIGENDAGQRADRFLIKACPQLPKSLLYKTFRKRDVKLNGKRIPPETFLQAGDLLQVYLPDDCFAPKAGQPSGIRLPEPEILFENGQIAVLKKPSGLPVHADNKGSADTLAGRFLQHLRDTGVYDPAAEQSFTPALCNRLDRSTEGIVLGGKTAAALRFLNEQIRTGRVEKEYLCITVGPPPKQADTVTAYHRRREGHPAEYSAVPREGFREMRTGYELLGSDGALSLLRVRLFTGRTHQIRLQTAALGCPVLGDNRYGSRAANEQFGENGQLLCAYRLRFAFSEAEGALADLCGMQFEIVPSFLSRYPSFAALYRTTHPLFADKSCSI